MDIMKRTENMERLTQKLKSGTYAPKAPLYDMCDKLGAYEDLEEQGKLMKLLCNVGDTVYQIIGGFIEPCTVKGIFLTGEKDENGNQLYMMGLHYDRENCIFTSAKIHSSYIGKTIFLTKEGAENELQIDEGIYAEEKEQPETE